MKIAIQRTGVLTAELAGSIRFTGRMDRSRQISVDKRGSAFLNDSEKITAAKFEMVDESTRIQVMDW